jgi:hypothetical protein
MENLEMPDSQGPPGLLLPGLPWRENIEAQSGFIAS